MNNLQLIFSRIFNFNSNKYSTIFAFILFLMPTSVLGMNYEIKEDLMTDNKTIYFFITSENTVRNSIGQEESGLLMIKCENGNPSFLMDTPTFNTERNIGVRWDKEKASYSDWSKSADGTAFFHRNPKTFINEMKERDYLTLAWTPYQRATEAFKYDLNSQNWKQDIEQAIKDGCDL